MKTEIVSIMAVCFCAIAFCAPSARAVNVDFYNDATIQNGDIYNVVNVYDSPPDQTNIHMTGGGVDLMRTYDYCTINLTGGGINTLGARGYSTVNIFGEAQIQSAGVNEWGSLNISGGKLNSAGATGQSMLNISGTGSVLSVRVSQSGMMNMTGGEIDRLQLFDSVIVNLYSGSIVEGISTRAGDFDGSINIYGYGLVKTSIGGLYGYGEVHGFYQDGTAFSIDLGHDIYPHVNLIPEPATIILLSLGAAILRKQKH